MQNIEDSCQKSPDKFRSCAVHLKEKDPCQPDGRHDDERLITAKNKAAKKDTCDDPDRFFSPEPICIQHECDRHKEDGKRDCCSLQHVEELLTPDRMREIKRCEGRYAERVFSFSQCIQQIGK